MSYQPSGLQTLFLWRLLANGGGAFLRDTKPKLDVKKDRKPLVAAGLIEIEKRKDPQPKKRAQKINYAFLTEQGWQWAAGHLDAEVSVAAGRFDLEGPHLGIDLEDRDVERTAAKVEYGDTLLLLLLVEPVG